MVTINPQRAEFNFTARMLLHGICRAGALGCLLWIVILLHFPHSIMALKLWSMSCFSSLKVYHFLNTQTSSKVPNITQKIKAADLGAMAAVKTEHTGLCRASQHSLHLILAKRPRSDSAPSFSSILHASGKTERPSSLLGKESYSSDYSVRFRWVEG